MKIKAYILVLFLLLLPSSIISAQQLVGYQYWFDDDYQENVYVESSSKELSLSVNISPYAPGTHYFNFRAKDNEGNWSSILTQYFYRTSVDDPTTHALDSYEYWIDNDYANKKTVANTDGIIAFNLDATTLREGMHYFNLRAKNKRGLYSASVTQYFYRTSVDDPTAQALDSYEYWIDNDYANKKTVANTNGIIMFNLDANALREGMHYFNFRAKNKRGMYSASVTQYFYRTSVDDPTTQALDSYEYWIDNDYANKKTVANTDGIITFDLDATTLKGGMHYFNLRAKNKRGLYSASVTQYFYRPSVDDPTAQALDSYEYWIDDNYANKQIAANTDGIIALDIDASGLRTGMHYFNFRAKNKTGNYSGILTQYFYKPGVGDAANNKICQYRYWFNKDWTTLQTIDVAPVNPLELQNVLIDVPAIIPQEIPDKIEMALAESSPQLTLHFPGDIELYMQFKDLAGEWSAMQVDTFAHDSQIKLSPTPLTINKGMKLQKTASSEVRAFSIDITKEDSLYWKTDQPCRIALYNPLGKQLCTLSQVDCLNGKRIESKVKGTYYALLHSAVKNETYPKDELTLICIGNNASDTIDVNPAGTLSELVGDPEIIVNLTLTGYLNGTDIRFIRSLPRLARLDISGAHIVEGGTTYYENYRTANEVTGDYMFSNLPKLIRLVLSNTTTTLGEKALYGCTGLTELTLPPSITTIGEKAIGGTQGNLLLIHWNTSAPIASAAFDAPEEMGNCLIYAPQSTPCTYKGNAVLGGLAEKIRLTHAKGFRCPEAFKAQDITYTRHFSMNSGNKEAAAGWESIALPFDVQTFSHAEKGELAPFNSGKEGTRPFWLAQLTKEDGFKHVTELKANVPYIISMPNSDAYEEEFNISGDVTFHAESEEGIEVRRTLPSAITRSEGPEFTMVPAYSEIQKHDTVYAINLTVYENIAIGGAFVRNLRAVSPFEAYTVSNASPSKAPKFYRIEGGGDLTGIDRILLKQGKNFKAYTEGNLLYIESDKVQTLSIYATDGKVVRTVKINEGKNRVTGLEEGIFFLEKTKIVIGK